MTDERLSERVEVARGRYCTTEEIMALFHVTKRTVYRWKEAGRLHPVKAGRRLLFERAEVEALAAEQGNFEGMESR